MEKIIKIIRGEMDHRLHMIGTTAPTWWFDQGGDQDGWDAEELKACYELMEAIRVLSAKWHSGIPPKTSKTSEYVELNTDYKVVIGFYHYGLGKWYSVGFGGYHIMPDHVKVIGWRKLRK